MITKIKSVLEELFKGGLCVICDLHKPCIAEKCTKTSIVQIYDFDKIKDSFCKDTNSSNYKSVDALILKQKAICFIEIKGWKDYLSNWEKVRFTPEQQVNRYELDNKYSDSVIILSMISRVNPAKLTRVEYQSFCSIPHYFILVTDIDVEKNPLESLSIGLNYLSENSNMTNLSESCIEQTTKYFDGVTFDKNKTITKKLVYCKNLDQCITSIYN